MIIDHMLNILDDQHDTTSESKHSNSEMIIKRESDDQINTVENKEYATSSKQNIFVVKDSSKKSHFFFKIIREMTSCQ